MTAFVPAQEIRRIAGRMSGAVLPDEDADTLPVPIRTDKGVALLVMYYRESGPPDQREVDLPHYAMHLDGETGKVLRFFACAPKELGIAPPLSPVPGADVDPAMDGLAFFHTRERLLDLSPALWAALASDAEVDASTAEAAKEYLAIFLRITKAEVAPFYLAAAPDFFEWLHSAAQKAP
jgi:hypothetical protein